MSYICPECRQTCHDRGASSTPQRICPHCGCVFAMAATSPLGAEVCREQRRHRFCWVAYALVIALGFAVAVVLAVLSWRQVNNSPAGGGSAASRAVGSGSGNANAQPALTPPASANNANVSNTPTTNQPPQTVFPPPPSPAPATDVTTPAPAAANPRVETNAVPGESSVIAYEFTRRLNGAGAKSGEVQLSLIWNNYNDLDLHCLDPNGERIYFGNRRSRSGGELDVDMNAGAVFRVDPVENIYWPERGAPRGSYQVYVHHYATHRSPDPTAFTVRVLVQGREQRFTGTLTHGEPARLMHTFTLAGQ